MLILSALHVYPYAQWTSKGEARYMYKDVQLKYGVISEVVYKVGLTWSKTKDEGT